MRWQSVVIRCAQTNTSPPCFPGIQTFYTLFYLSLLLSSCSPFPCMCLCGFAELFSFPHPLILGPLGPQSYQMWIQIDHSGSSSCSLIAHQPVWVGGLFLVIVSIFALSGLCLSILLIVPPSLLLIISVQTSPDRQPCLNQHFHIPSIFLPISTKVIPITISLSYYPLLH